MKRRAFLSLTGAALSAPFLPHAALARAAPTSGHMALASHLARYNPQISAAGLVRVLKVPASTAQQIMGQMMRQGIVAQASIGPVDTSVRQLVERVMNTEDLSAAQEVSDIGAREDAAEVSEDVTDASDGPDATGKM